MPKVTPEYFEKKKEQIVEAAYQVCLRKPVEMVTISDVITETGMSMGAIYRYYEGLDEILADMMKRIREDYNSWDSILALTKEKNMAFEEIVYKAFDILGEIMEEHLMDIQKINFDFGVLAVNNPERMAKIMSGISAKGNMENLITNIFPMMAKAAGKQGYKMKCSTEEIGAFIVSTYAGIEKNCIFSTCYGTSNSRKNIGPRTLFRTLAQSVILLFGGSVD